MDSELITNIKAAIEQGRSDIVRSLLEACEKGTLKQIIAGLF